MEKQLRKKIYLDNTTLDEAIKRWSDKTMAGGLRPLEGESIPAGDSLGRITAEAVFAKLSSPFYHSSAMDGYAVRFADTFGASETSPKRLKIGPQAIYRDTGNPLPEGFNAVIMIEDVNIMEEANSKNKTDAPEFIEIIRPAVPWQNVRVIGEDIVSTELILPENHKIRPVDIGAIVSGGHVHIKVRRKPKVVIIPTGSEIVESGTELKKGEIIDFNSLILSSLVGEWGGEALRIKPVPDVLEKIKQTIIEGAEQGDIVIVIAGSSAGSADFTSEAIAETGEVILHGVNIKPGRPLILGWVKNRPVIGIPGYPVSAYITFNLFAKEIIYRMQGLEPPAPEYMKAKLSRQIASSLGHEEFLRVKLGKVGNNIIATPISRGAGVLMSLVRADGFVRIPSMSEGLGAGAEVNVEMLRQKSEIENTIVCIGSHDNALDLLANILKKNHPRFSLSSAHVGSMGGLMALKKGEAHIAGTHLLDEKTGEYNISYINRILEGRKIVLINLVYRQQGLIVLKGNPKNISGFGDLTRDDVCFINRQSGAGTRLLTDKYLKENKILPENIEGYEREEYTHMGIASAVLTGIADTGMGILAAANALGLDFIPLANERYDLAMPAEYLESVTISALLNIIRTDNEFRTSVLKLGGYDISDMGRVIYES
jgi:putative molybdopterin biosynthesis protein